MFTNLGLVVLLASIILSHAMNKENYPNPATERSRCWKEVKAANPPQDLRVCDPDNQLESYQAIELNNILTSIRRDSRCPCKDTVCHVSVLRSVPKGYTVTLTLVKSMDDGLTGNVITRARTYVEYLRDEGRYYGTQFARCDDDIIVMMSLDEQVVYVLTGAMVRPKLSDATLTTIIEDSHKEFANSLFNGLKFILQQIKDKLVSA